MNGFRISLACLMLLSTPALAQRLTPAQERELHTVRTMVPHCKAALNNRNNNALFPQGVCQGFIRGYIAGDPLICEPDNWTFHQAIMIFVQYAEKDAGRWHEHFMYVVRDSLRKAWPCKDASTSSPSPEMPNGALPASRVREY